MNVRLLLGFRSLILAQRARAQPVYPNLANVTEVALPEAAKGKPPISGKFVAEALIDVDCSGSTNRCEAARRVDDGPVQIPISGQDRPACHADSQASQEWVSFDSCGQFESYECALNGAHDREHRSIADHLDDSAVVAHDHVVDQRIKLADEVGELSVVEVEA